MKTNSPSAERSSLPREFGIIDTLVLMLAVALFAAWILGTLFLYFFPAGASASVNSQTAALAVSADGPSGVPAANSTQGSDDETGAANDAGDSNTSNAAGSNSNQIQATGGLASEEKSELEQKISKLEEQLETKSEELTELRKTSKASKESAKPDREAAAAASRYKSQISQLNKQKDRLDRDIKKLKDESKTQKTKIQTLQDKLATAAKAVPMAGAINAEENLTGLRGDIPQNQPLEFRDWISSKGNKARLAFVRWEDDEIVVINEDDKTFRLTLNRLSPADQKYVNSKR